MLAVIKASSSPTAGANQDCLVTWRVPGLRECPGELPLKDEKCEVVWRFREQQHCVQVSVVRFFKGEWDRVGLKIATDNVFDGIFRRFRVVQLGRGRPRHNTELGRLL